MIRGSFWTRGPALLVLLLGQGAAGQGGRLSRPILGYTYEPGSEELRPIEGLAGAAVLGEPLNLPFRLRHAVVAPSQDFALVLAGDEGRPAVVNLSGEPYILSEITGARGDPERVVLSPAGTAAALYSRAAQQVQVIRGLPKAPVVAAALDLPVAEGELSALAVNDAADLLLAAVSRGSNPGLFVLRIGEPPRLVFPAGEIASIAFSFGGSDAVFADRARNEVYLLRDAGGGAQLSFLAGSEDGISDPVGLEISRENGWVLIANAGSRTVGMLGDQGGPVKLFPCNCDVTGLQKLAGKAVRISGGSSGPIWLLDGDPAGPRIVFVPRRTEVNGGER